MNCSQSEQIDILRVLLRTDLYFLLWYGCGRKDFENQWLFDRCREVQANPDGNLDLWAREHYKSTVITFGLTIQDILSSHGEDPLPKWEGRELTFGIFSHTRPIAKDFLKQIKNELAGNTLLHKVFPDILYSNPERESPKWSEDAGLRVKRKTNPKEETVEAHGLVDGMPTGKHFVVRIYDDVVTEKSVNTPEMIKKTTQAWGLSLSLGSEGGIERYVGTRYNYSDTYADIMKSGVPARIHPATDNGKSDGKPVFRSQAWVDDKKRAGSYTFACQQLLNPKEDSLMSFNVDDVRYFKEFPRETNNYILCDPANSKKKSSDYTSFWVIGCGADENWYVLYALRDRLSLTERADKLFELHRQYRPLGVGYEKYGMQSDIDHFQDRMERESYRFEITPCAGPDSKDNRILRLTPRFEEHCIWFPKSFHQTLRDGTTQDMVQVFIDDELKPFPVGIHPDMLDSLSRMFDLDIEYPNDDWGEPLEQPVPKVA